MRSGAGTVPVSSNHPTSFNAQSCKRINFNFCVTIFSLQFSHKVNLSSGKQAFGEPGDRDQHLATSRCQRLCESTLCFPGVHLIVKSTHLALLFGHKSTSRSHRTLVTGRVTKIVSPFRNVGTRWVNMLKLHRVFLS